MKLQNMRYFVETAKRKTISETARQLFISQSTLSTALQEMEKELGVHLFTRGKKGVILTPEGEDCFKYCQEIIERSDALMDRYAGGSPADNYFSVATSHLPFAVRAFSKLTGECSDEKFNLCIREETLFNVVEEISSGRSEIGIIAVTDEQLALIERHNRKELEFTALDRLRKFVFLNRQHPLAGRERLGVSDLTEYPYVTYDQGETASVYTEENVFYKMFPRNIHVCDRATKMAMIRNGNAFTIGVDLPNYSADHFFRETSAELIAIPYDDREAMETVGCLRKAGMALSTTGERYLELLKKEILELK